LFASKDTRSNFNKGEYTPRGVTKRDGLEGNGMTNIQSGASDLGGDIHCVEGVQQQACKREKQVRGMACTFVKMARLGAMRV